MERLYAVTFRMGQVFGTAKVSNAHPELQQLVSYLQETWGGPLDIVFGGRTDAQQAALYAEGRTIPGNIVTNAKTAAESAHGFRLFNSSPACWALDIAPCNDAGVVDWSKAAEPGLKAALTQINALVQGAFPGVFTWGGDPSFGLGDFDHWEVKGWRLATYTGLTDPTDPDFSDVTAGFSSC